MTAPARTWIRVDELQTAQLVRYHGRAWTVLDVLPMAAPLSGCGVIGLDSLTGERQILPFHNPSATAEVIAS